MGGVANHYSYRVQWSPDNGYYLGTVTELPSESWFDSDPIETLKGIWRCAEETVADLEADGEEVPTPLADRNYSGKFIVRIPPEVHRRLTMEAAEQNISLNRLVVSRLVQT